MSKTLDVMFVGTVKRYVAFQTSIVKIPSLMNIRALDGNIQGNVDIFVTHYDHEGYSEKFLSAINKTPNVGNTRLSVLSILVLCKKSDQKKALDIFSSKTFTHLMNVRYCTPNDIEGISSFFSSIDSLIEQEEKSAAFEQAKTESILKEFTHRIDLISNQIRATRVNSVQEFAFQLEEISQEMRGHIRPEKYDLKSQSLKVLKVLTGLFEALGTERGAQVIISGAVAGILGSSGWSTTTIYALTMAVWAGGPSFLKAVADLFRQHQSG